jgi:multidrug resistance efflux pump
VKNKTLLILMFCLLFPFILTGFRFKKVKPEKKVIQVEVKKLIKGNITTYFSLLGWGRYEKRSYIYPRVGGEVEKIYKEAGDTVLTGELLAQLDTRDLELDKKSLQLQLKKAEFTLQKMNSNYQLQKITLENALKQAEINLSIKKNNYLKLKNGARKEEIQEAYQNWQRIVSQKAVAEKDYQRLKKLYKKKMVSAQNYDKAYYGYLSLKAQAESSKLRYVLLKKGTRKEDLALARLQVQLGEANLKLAKEKLMQLDLLQRDIEIQKNMLQDLQVKLKNIENKISDTRIKAPFSGIVMERLISQGELVNSGRKLFFLMGGRKEIAFTFSEDDLPYLHLGTKVKIKFPYLKDKEMVTGEIIQLIPWKDRNLQKLKGIIFLKSRTPVFVDGAFAHLIFKKEEKKNIFRVPLIAVVQKFDGNFLFVVQKKKNGLHSLKIPVKLGLSNSREIEVISPQLKEGMEYITNSQDLEGNEKIKILNSQNKDKKGLKKKK